MPLQAALQLTQAQQRDVLYLRRLFYSKLGALARDRQDLLRQIPTGAAETAASTSSQLGQTAEMAQALQANSAAELRAYMQFLSAFGRGVRNNKHVAYASHTDSSLYHLRQG